ncbi:MAG: peptide ABC transporter substrate-binding protein [Bdellovibrionaceae bacterium]|nr:peptide ABC transporter substrate-binding protein [Pseudobdellovibrionaceae bacterium]
MNFLSNLSRIFLPTKILFLFGTLVLSPLCLAEPVFRLHLASEPINLMPSQQKTSSASYLMHNLYRNLFTYDDDQGLIPDLGDSCKRENPLVLICKVKKNLKWSDGSPLVASDFLKAYQRILDSKESAPRADLLFKIKNALAIYKNQEKMESLGISSPSPDTLRFEFAEADPDFEYNLASIQLAPIKNQLFSAEKANELVVSGPYRISKWIQKEKIVLENNPHYKSGNADRRPKVEFLFVAEDSVALQLYEKNELSFLRRLPTLYIPKFKNRPDFLWVPVIRFDYIGFGPELKKHPKLREALALALNFPELKKIFSAEGMPGCVGVPLSFVLKELCYRHDLQKAKLALSQDKNTPTNLKLMYSSLGGEDHRRAAEWLQSQWSKNLNIKVQVVMRENKVFLRDLQKETPSIFRKGVAPDRPTCLATLETFANWSSENYIQLNESDFQSILKKLSETTNLEQQKKICTLGLSYLMDQFYLIPTGPIHFAMLIRPEFQGWKLNSMNQLDLASLKTKELSQTETKKPFSK